MSSSPVTGLHHITALASSAQYNLDFYAGILGLRLVKKTINFDNPKVYHLYYGDELGTPGSIMTFFPYEGLARGSKGKGQVAVSGFAIPQASVDFWQERLVRFGVKHMKPQKRLDEESYIYLEDPDGLGLELVATPDDSRTPWADGPVPPEHAVRGIHGVTIWHEACEATTRLLLDLMGHTLVMQEGARMRYSTGGQATSYLDLVCMPDTLRGNPGAGTVHHVAFNTPSDESLTEMRNLLVKAGVNVTPVLDRQYFHSIYFREPGGVLFEVATTPPGFAYDEPVAELGGGLKLPPWEEEKRETIAAGLRQLVWDPAIYR